MKCFPLEHSITIRVRLLSWSSDSELHMNENTTYEEKKSTASMTHIVVLVCFWCTRREATKLQLNRFMA